MKKLAILLVFALNAIAAAGVPEPAVIVYGRVRDAYGFPYVDGGRVIFSKGGVEVARCNLGGLLSEGLNFRAALNVDNGGSPYTANSVRSGDSVTVAVEVGGSAMPLMPTNRITVGAPGSTIRLDLCTGTDADHDGLPDEWELLLCEQSGGKLSGIADVKPGDDFDGDGLSNMAEFYACTFPFLATDILKVGEVGRVGANRIKLRFLTSQGVSYRPIAVGSFGSEPWCPMRFTDVEGGELAYRELLGDGEYRTIYIESDAKVLFVRLAAQ